MDERWLRYEAGIVIREVRRRLENLVRFNTCNHWWIAIVGEQIAAYMKAQDADTYREGVRRGWIKEWGVTANG